MRPTELDSRRTIESPYDLDRLPELTQEELKQVGFPSGGDEEEATVHIATTVRPSLVYTIDRLIERRVYGFKSRQQFFRTALVVLAQQTAHAIQDEAVQLLMKRLENQRGRLRQWLLIRDANQMVVTTTKTVRLMLGARQQIEALKALRAAKRFIEDLPETFRQRVVVGLYGSVDGVEKPEGWEQDEAARLWHEVWEGRLDKDDEEEQIEQSKVY